MQKSMPAKGDPALGRDISVVALARKAATAAACDQAIAALDSEIAAAGTRRHQAAESLACARDFDGARAALSEAEADLAALHAVLAGAKEKRFHLAQAEEAAALDRLAAESQARAAKARALHGEKANLLNGLRAILAELEHLETALDAAQARLAAAGRGTGIATSRSIRREAAAAAAATSGSSAAGLRRSAREIDRILRRFAASGDNATARKVLAGRRPQAVPLRQI